MNNIRRKAIKQTIDRFDSIRKKLDELAMFLYEKETITGEEFMEILNKEESEKK